MHAFETPKGFLERSGPGDPLPTGVKQRMERYFGADFSDVRVHVGPEARSIGALAFTLGSDIYFSPEQYRPGTRAGQELLGHELTHVVQQREGRVANPFGDGVAVVQDFELEAEADRHGKAVAQGRLGPKVGLGQNPFDPARERPAARGVSQKMTGGRPPLQRSEVPRPKLPFSLGGPRVTPKKKRGKKKVVEKVVKKAPPIEVMEEYKLAIQGSDTFRSWIKYWVRVVAREALGRALLSEFANNVTHSFRWKSKEVTIAINEKTVASDQPVRTGSFNGWHEDGAREGMLKWGQEVPLISMSSPGLVNPRVGDLTLTGTGKVLNHPDCYDIDLDVAIFHELCHAYYWQIGATKDLQDFGTIPLVGLFQGGGMMVDPKENTEEQLVSGLWAGKGLTYCENSYRATVGLPPRTQYSASSVGIVDQDLVLIAGNKNWAKTWNTWRAGASVSNVFRANGYTTLADAY